MALYSQIEDRYLSALTAVQFPEAPVADTQQSVTNATSVDGMQLAAGPSQTVTDAGAGRGSYAGFDPRQDAANKAPMGEVKPYDPTVREQLAEFLQAGFERFGMDRYKARKNAQTLIGGPNSNLPLNMGLADIVPFLGTALQTQEAVRMGEDAVTSAKQGNYGTAALQAGGAALGLVPGAAGTVRAAKPLVPKAAEMMIDAAEKTGMPVRGLGIVEPGQAMRTNVQVKMPTDPVFAEAVSNTPGAQVTEDGLLMNVVRFQKPEQEGDAAIRTGVFYLPSGAASAKHYKTGKTGYGGTEKFEGQTLIRSPMFVKGATGGKAPEAAYDQLKGKKAYENMRDEVLKSYGYNSTESQKIEAVRTLLEKYNGIDQTDAYDQAYMIVRNSKTGNTLPYAVQENIVAHAVRGAGYDAVVGYSKGKAGASISEVFDVREQTFPARGMESQIHDAFTQ